MSTLDRFDSPGEGVVPEPTHEMVRVDLLVLDQELQARARLNESHLSRLEGVMREHEIGANMTIDVVNAGARGLLVLAGFHRVEAARRAGVSELPCRIHHINAADAFLLAATSNARHGLPLAPRDRVKALRMLMIAGAPGGQPWTQLELAEWLGVTQGAVSKMLARIKREDERGDIPRNTPRRPRVAALVAKARLLDEEDLRELYVQLGEDIAQLDIDAAGRRQEERRLRSVAGGRK